MLNLEVDKLMKYKIFSCYNRKWKEKAKIKDEGIL